MKPHLDVNSQPSDDLPYSLPLELSVHDPDVIAELCGIPEGPTRDEFAIKALRIGIFALRQARGQLDAELIRRECNRLLSGMEGKLDEHAKTIHDRLGMVLKEYFDPQSGRFSERVDRLVRQDGDLERVLRRQIGGEDSQLCKTLAAHLGLDSPLMKHLSPDQSSGLMSAFRDTFDKQLTIQREHLLSQFSLDNKDGALSRFIRELVEHHGKLSHSLQGQIKEVVAEFSLDNEDSALSRLVRNVDRAQRTITSEFSLDDETSALSRLKRLLENNNEAIHGHLSLDDEKSALSRLKREMLGLLKEDREINRKFQEEVKGALQAMVARREEAARGTQHGMEFEDVVFEFVQYESQRRGDTAYRTGNATGLLPYCKIGDCVVELGPECAAAGAKIVVEAKEKERYNLSKAREEIKQARNNREAQVGVFVYSKKTAPSGMEPLDRIGSDVFVVWDAENSQSDLFLKAGLSVARALCVRTQRAKEAKTADFSAIDEAILRIQHCAESFDDLEKMTTTIQNNSGKILKKLGSLRKSLEKHVEILEEKTAELKSTFATSGNGGE